MKKNIVIVVLGILVLGLSGILIYQNMNDKKEEPKENKSENENVVKETRIKEYKHYTEAEIVMADKDYDDYDYSINLKIENKKLVEKKRGLTIKGIEGKVKYFTYDEDCGSTLYILVVTEEGNIYVAPFNIWFDSDAGETIDSIKSIEFKKVNTKEKVVDVTVYPILGWCTCKAANIGAVLENGEIRPVYPKYDDNDNFLEYVISTDDYSNYEEQVYEIVLYADHTIAIADYKNTFPNEQSKIKYNNELLKINKIYNVNSDDENFYYVISEDNKLYRIDVQAEEGIFVSFKSVELVNDKIVKEVGVTTVGEKIYNIESETITFTDGTTMKLENLDYIYISNR